MTPSVVRAWVHAHDGVVVAAAMIITAVSLRVGASWLLPVPGTARQVPFWQLTPALLAMLASLASVNRLPVGVSPQHRAARLLWALVVLGGACLSAAGVGAGTGLPSLVPGTAAAVALTLGAAAVVGRGSVWIGAGLALVALSRTTRVAATDDLWHDLPVGAQWVVVVVAVLGMVGYARAGVRYP